MWNYKCLVQNPSEDQEYENKAKGDAALWFQSGAVQVSVSTQGWANWDRALVQLHMLDGWSVSISGSAAVFSVILLSHAVNLQLQACKIHLIIPGPVAIVDAYTVVAQKNGNLRYLKGWRNDFFLRSEMADFVISPIVDGGFVFQPDNGGSWKSLDFAHQVGFVGQSLGNARTWHFNAGWKSHLEGQHSVDWGANAIVSHADIISCKKRGCKLSFAKLFGSQLC